MPLVVVWRGCVCNCVFSVYVCACVLVVVYVCADVYVCALLLRSRLSGFRLCLCVCQSWCACVCVECP